MKKGGSTKVTLGLADNVFWIFTTKSTVGKYDHMLLCNGVQYKQIRAIGGVVVLQRVSDWATARVDRYAARQSAGSV